MRGPGGTATPPALTGTGAIEVIAEPESSPMSTVNLLSGIPPLIQVPFAAGVRSNNGAYKHSADQGMPDVQALEIRRPRRLLPAATAGPAPVRPHSPLEPPRNPGERLGPSFSADDAALTRSRCRASASKTSLAQTSEMVRTTPLRTQTDAPIRLMTIFRIGRSTAVAPG
jgi:hypothetical protein